MIELTEEQARAVEQSREPPTLLNPRTNTTYVLVRRDVYERLQEVYDDSPWTDEEMDLLAAEDADRLGWEGMEMYQDEVP